MYNTRAAGTLAPVLAPSRGDAGSPERGLASCGNTTWGAHCCNNEQESTWGASRVESPDVLGQFEFAQIYGGCVALGVYMEGVASGVS